MRRICCCGLLLMVVWLLAGWAGSARADGSAVVFSTLWTPAQLAGIAAEKHSGRRGVPDRSGPASTMVPLLPPVPGRLQGSIRRVNTDGRKLVALTFDLCELADQVAGYDGAVVDALRAARAKATFFAGGKWMRSHPRRAMQLISDPLFEIGNHAWTHGNFGRLDAAGMRREINWTQAQYALLRAEIIKRAREHGVTEAEIDRIPPAPVLFRFPYGRCRPEALQLLAASGLAAIQWDLTTRDPERDTTPQRILQTVLDRVRPGDIIIGHANGNGHGTSGAVPELIRQLRRRGYTLVTVSELLAAGRPVVASDCYDAHPGDTAQYDRLFGDGTVHPPRRHVRKEKTGGKPF